MNNFSFEDNIKQFLIIWDNYSHILSIQPSELEMFIGVIDRLRTNCPICLQDKKTLVNIIELVTDSIYTANSYKNGYEISYYEKTNIYDEPQLKCCSSLICFLQTDIIWNLENET